MSTAPSFVISNFTSCIPSSISNHHSFVANRRSICSGATNRNTHSFNKISSSSRPNATNIKMQQDSSSASSPDKKSNPTKGVVTILDYGAGNVRSLENAVRLLGFDIVWAQSPEDILNAEKLIFPGVGSFGAAMENLESRNFIQPLREYILADRPYLGICLGLHTLFTDSDESPGIPGLDLFPGTIRRFQFDSSSSSLSIPHIGWNTIELKKDSALFQQHQQAGVEQKNQRFYFVHSYRVGQDIANEIPDMVLGTTEHGEEYLSVLQRGHICATQFHPEKSGAAGLNLIRNFLTSDDISKVPSTSNLNTTSNIKIPNQKTGLAKRVVACLDVRENDDGDLVVTKGDQYDVRETSSGNVRNLGKPVSLAQRYFREGADEIVFLNITSFRGEPIGSAPMLEVLRETSRRVFVPLCIGGGIRDYSDKDGKVYSALDVADTYFRAGADKVSIGSDAVYAAEEYWERNGKCDGKTSIERISNIYGAQAVVVSIDPRRVYVEEDKKDSSDNEHEIVNVENNKRCWYQCTVKGGREGRNIDVVKLAKAVEKLGAGEILLNSMDCDGQNNGYDFNLINLVRRNVSIPVIASSGAGSPAHFSQCFDNTDVEAALAAGIFHRREVAIDDVKLHLVDHGTRVRLDDRVDELIGVDVAAAVAEK